MMILSKGVASVFSALALAASLSLVAVEADARPGKGSSFGSRGTRTYTAPPPTQVSPGMPGQMNRSTMQRPATPAAAPAAPRAGGMFSGRPLMAGLAAGFLGAGLFGLLSGSGLFGGLGGMASFIGLLVQLAIVFFVARLLIGWWRRRSANQPAYAGAPAGAGPQPMNRDAMRPEPLRQVPPSVPTGGSRGYQPQPNPASYAPAGAGAATGGLFDPARDKVGLTQADLDAFDKLLRDVQGAYGRQDVAALRELVTPEVREMMEADLRADREEGIVNRIGEVRLLDGDLSEAWAEGDVEYATVAMRYAIQDQVVDLRTGQVVDQGPPEVSEYWTFIRPRGGYWELSGVQPTN